MRLGSPSPLGPIKAVNGSGSNSSIAAMVLNPLMVILAGRFPMESTVMLRKICRDHGAENGERT